EAVASPSRPSAAIGSPERALGARHRQWWAGLGGKLLLAFGTVILVGVSTLWVAVSLTAPGLFEQHMHGMMSGSTSSMMGGISGAHEATERRRRELIGDVAHELRTPIATLEGYLEGLLDGVVQPEPSTWPDCMARQAGCADSSTTCRNCRGLRRARFPSRWSK